MKHLALLGLLTASLLHAVAPRSLAMCGDSAGDEAAVVAARAQVEEDCPCDSFTTHGEYVSCAAAVAKERARAGLLPNDCKGPVKRCAARSTCGKSGFVICCRTSAAGRRRCQAKAHASLCKPPRGGTACVSSVPSCCDACTEAGCASPTTTTTTTTTSTTTTSQPGTCRLDDTGERCVGTCPVSGDGCVLAASGGCTCSPFVCRQCFLTIGVNICINNLCSATERCAHPNEYCDLGDCPAVECPCCPVCGDGVCVQQDESPCSCPADCGAGSCDPQSPTCGDFRCDRFATPGERHETCPQDCPFACHSCS